MLLDQPPQRLYGSFLQNIGVLYKTILYKTLIQQHYVAGNKKMFCGTIYFGRYLKEVCIKLDDITILDSKVFLGYIK